MKNKILSLEEIISISHKPARICGIYFLLYKTELVYIGKSVSILTRLGEHLIFNNKLFDSYGYIECSEQDLNSLETQYLIKYTPKYNKIITGWFKPNSYLRKKVSEIISQDTSITHEDLNIIINKYNPESVGGRYKPEDIAEYFLKYKKDITPNGNR